MCLRSEIGMTQDNNGCVVNRTYSTRLRKIRTEFIIAVIEFTVENESYFRIGLGATTCLAFTIRIIRVIFRFLNMYIVQYVRAHREKISCSVTAITIENNQADDARIKTGYRYMRIFRP